MTKSKEEGPRRTPDELRQRVAELAAEVVECRKAIKDAARYIAMAIPDESRQKERVLLEINQAQAPVYDNATPILAAHDAEVEARVWREAACETRGAYGPKNLADHFEAKAKEAEEKAHG